MNICRIVSYLNTRLRDDDEPTLAQIAQHHGYSAAHFSREFKRHAGFSIKQCIEALKIQQGIEHILDHGMSVTDSALAAGYSSLGTFSNTFKSHTGITASDYPRETTKAQVMLQKMVRKKATFTHHRSKEPTENTLDVKVHYPEGYHPEITCIGLFPTAIPKGAPVVGNALVGHAETTLTDIPTGEYYLLACELRYSANPARVLRDNYRQRLQQPLKFPESSGSDIELTMRPPAPQDPPITMNFPVLVMRRLLQFRSS